MRLTGRQLRAPGPAGRWALLLALVPLWACDKDDEVTYTQFNDTDDVLTIQVGAPSVLDAVTTELHSTTGSVVVGTATVDPGGGPVGTEHRLTVVVDDAYEDQVVRVTVRTDSGSRGEDEYELVGDSADEGLWQITLVSAGAADEVREDAFTIRLWENGTTIVSAEDSGE